MSEGRIERIERIDQLLKLIRTELRGETEQAAAVVNRWFDEDPERYAEAVLSAELGTHHEQYSVYQRLTCERRAAFFRRAVARCRAEGRGGLDAGAFMIGRFVCTAHPVAFWNQLEDHEVSLLLDEWVLHGRYLKVLDQVGERRIQRARAIIVEQGLAEIRVTQGDAAVFIPLKLSRRDLGRVAELGDERTDAQTHRLLELLRRPYGQFFDFDAPWSVGRLRRICDEAGLPMPRPDDV